MCAVLLSAISTGCGNKTEEKAEKKENKQENSGEVKKGNDPVQESMTKKEDNAGANQQSDANKSNELGMTPGLPNDFPSDVPLPKNSKTKKPQIRLWRKP